MGSHAEGRMTLYGLLFVFLPLQITLDKLTRAAHADVARQHYLTMLQRKALLALADYWLWRQEKALKLYRAQGHMNGYKLVATLEAWRRVGCQRAQLLACCGASVHPAVGKCHETLVNRRLALLLYNSPEPGFVL